jgi:hypothetical protein
MNIGGAVVVVALYLGGAAGILWLVLRSSRNLLDRKQAALTAGLQSAGASSRGTTEGGLYQGTDVSFELGGREVISNVRFVSESWGLGRRAAAAHAEGALRRSDASIGGARRAGHLQVHRPVDRAHAVREPHHGGLRALASRRRSPGEVAHGVDDESRGTGDE